MKFLLCAVALIAVVLLQNVSAQSNHAFWGFPGLNDTHVFSLNVVRDSRWLQQVEETIVWPPPVRIVSQIYLICSRVIIHVVPFTFAGCDWSAFDHIDSGVRPED